MRRRRWACLVGAGAYAAVACVACAPLTLEPVAPPPVLPEQWKSLDAASVPGDSAGLPWQVARPSDDAPKGAWWEAYGDPVLDDLERRALQDSYTLQVAVARLDLAVSQVAAHAAALQPVVVAGATATRARTSANRPLSSYAVPNASTVQDEFRASLGVSYEWDWLGRIRLDVQGARASAQQAAADLENVRLLLAAQVASSYLQLRAVDEEMAVVSSAAVLQDKVVDLVGRRYRGGAASQADLAQQTALAQSTRAQLELLGIQRSQQEDSLATLTGTPAAQFRLGVAGLPGTLPQVPLAMPSRLLERRPDIASAERAMAAANAQIGVARAAYYPVLSLAPTLLGYDANVLSALVAARSVVWSFGAAATQTLFDGGRADAGVAAAKANHAATVANYRQTVLQAIQETQDALSALQALALAQRRQDEAVRNEDQASRIGLVRYQEGLDNALTLAVTQQNQLTALRVQAQIRGSQFLSSVALIKALGGGWAGLEVAH